MPAAAGIRLPLGRQGSEKAEVPQSRERRRHPSGPDDRSMEGIGMGRRQLVNRHGSESADALEAEMIGGSENYGELLKTVGFLTRAVQIRIFREFFAEFSEGDVTPATHATLHLIWKNPGIRQGRIADMLDIEESTSRSQYTRAKQMLEDILIRKKILPKPREKSEWLVAIR